MRLILARCLIALLALALVGGNVHARIRLAVPAQPVSAEHLHHHSGPSSQHDRQRNDAARCCCDGLGCMSAAYTISAQSGASMSADFGSVVRYDGGPALLRGRDLLPEPKPPRPGSPS